MWAACAAAQQRPRIDIWTFQYGGATEEHDKAFLAFMSMLHDRILTLAGELTALDSSLSYLKGLSHLEVRDAKGKPVQFRGNPNNLQLRWLDEGTLVLLYGLIRKPTARFRVRSHFYYGEFQGELASSSVQLETDFRLEDFALASESHTAATIYAIAMEAEARGLPNPIIVDLLSKAQSYALGVDDAEGIAPLNEAIAKSLARLGGDGS